MSEQFIELFDRWSAEYDQSVAGNDLEYKKVFEHYNDILRLIAFRSHGNIIEFGVGTGNLTKKLIDFGHQVVGIEPSSKMREITKKKLPYITVLDGHFLDFPQDQMKVDTFTSSYAFHHLTDEDKEKAIKLYAKLLPKGGKIIFGDTIFPTKKDHQLAIQTAKNEQFNRLAEDLSTEYYTTIPKLDRIFKKYNFNTHYEQLNDFVWLIEAKKVDNIEG